ncbi:MAG TPA: cyclic nucleotide-binding domain-containing protein [Bryobacteraceae bacterium]|jgi:CRP-like cAMP-binding protein|nr:cyclic nucleotide-binding domain-containing protein [Bryobacteraceae bacterium]
MQSVYSDSTESENGKALFKSLDQRTAAKLVQIGIEARFEPGETIFRPHDESGQFYCLICGSIALEKPGAERAIRIETLHGGDFVGWSALLGSGTRHFQARALTRAVVLTFDGALVRKACEADPRFGYDLMKHLLFVATERLDATRIQLAEMQKGYVRDWGTAVA